MTHTSLPQRSLKHEYELFVEREIERYKEAVPRSVMLAIADDAVAALSARPQLALTELMLCGEVDQLIAARLRLPKFRDWRRRHLNALQEYRRPEHWGIRPDAPIVRAIASAAESHVLIAGATEPGPAIYLAANGCAVTALEGQFDAIDRVMCAAERAGLTRRVRGYLTDYRSWVPDVPLDAVVYSPAVLEGLNGTDRANVIARLQSATTDGGVHLIQSAATAPTGGDTQALEEFHARYSGWRTSVECQDDARTTFFARKALA